MKVVVIGGGVIGLCAAHALAQAGAEVTVVERDRCGQAASLGNAGWVAPVLSAPLPAPKVMGQSLRWMLKPDSPLLIRPRLSPSFMAWCWRFWRNSSPRPHRAGLEAILALNRQTLELFDELQANGVEFEMHSTGLVFVGLTEKVLSEELRVFSELQQAGYAGETESLDRKALDVFEPALSDAVAGGLHAKQERYVQPETFTRGLVDRLARIGVRLLEDSEVRGLSRRGRWRVRTSDEEELGADRVIVAAGAWTGQLLAPLGVRIPLEAAKGYSVTAIGRGTRPRHALYMLEAKVGCSPFQGAVRLAGTLELAGIDLSLNRRRIAAVVRAASTYLRDWQPEGVELEWAGLRPLMPDGLPVIGAVPGHDGLYVATGHGMLGVTLAPATAAALTPLILEGRLPPVLEPFRADRKWRSGHAGHRRWGEG
jgi:D-amino-acid dehydrogenase